jgi:hypothetical protein
MKNIAPIIIIGASLLAAFFWPIGAQAQGNQGHHQSGIFGHINGGIIIATPDGEGSSVIPNHVRVYTNEGELLTEVETVVTEDAWWYFEVFLKPGAYTVSAYMGSPPEDGGIAFTYPVEVTVGKKEFLEVAFTFVPTTPRIPLIPIP